MNDTLKQVLLSAVLAVVSWVGSALLFLEVLDGVLAGLVGNLGLLLIVFVVVPTVVGFGAVKTLEFETMWFCLGVGLGYVSLMTAVSVVAGGGELHPVFLAAMLLPATTCLGALLEALVRRWQNDESGTRDRPSTE